MPTCQVSGLNMQFIKRPRVIFFIHNGGVQVIQERRGIVSKLEIEARMRENKAQAQVSASMYFQEFFKVWWPRDLLSLLFLV